MARAAITVLKLTTANSSVSAVPTMAAVDTDTGAYINCKNIDASKMILVFNRTVSGTAAASANNIVIMDGDSKAGYTAYALGDLKIAISSHGKGTAPTAGNAACDCVFVGPFETARFKDSDGYIKINCSVATNITSIGAILI